MVPTGTSIRGGRYAGRWRAARVRDAWEGRAQVGRRGASLTLTYTGGLLEVVGDVWPQGGVARFMLDGRSETIDLRNVRPHARQVLFSRRVPEGRHHLRIFVLKGPVPLEGVAIADRRR